MRKLFTTIASCLFVFSLFGQTTINNYFDYKLFKNNDFNEPEFGQKLISYHSNEKQILGETLKLDSLNKLIWDDSTKSYVPSLRGFYYYDSLNNYSYLLGYNLDSSKQWILGYKEECKYDDNGILTSQKYFHKINSSNEFVCYYEECFITDSNSNITTSKTYFEWDDSTKQNYAYTKNEFTKDKNNNEISNIYYYYDDSTKQLVKSNKNEFTYDNPEKKTSSNEYYWNKSTKEWMNSLKWEYSYNYSGNLIYSYSYDWVKDSLAWKIHYKYEYTYDENEKLILQKCYYWNNVLNDWNDSQEKTEYINDFNGNRICSILYFMQYGSNVWEYLSKAEYSYDINNKQTSFIYYDWNDTISQWKIWHKEEKTYDEFGNIETTTYTHISNENLFSQKIDYIYDYSFNFSDLIFPYWKNQNIFSGSVILKEYIGYTLKNGNWLCLGKIKFYYSGFLPNNITNISTTKLSVFPNPTSDFVSFNLNNNTANNSTIEFYDIQGKLVLSQKIVSNQQVSVSNLKSGIYLYKINSNDKIYEGKISIK